MATINVLFNNKEYPIDESSLSSATSALKTHLSTIMNGSGATVALDGTSYNVDSTKLSTVRNNFVSYLGTISGSGAKVVVNGVEYSVDSTKLATAIADLHTVLGGLNSGSEGGEGSDTTTEKNEYGFYFNRLYVSDDMSTAVGFCDNMFRIYIPNENIDDYWEPSYATPNVTYDNLLVSLEVMDYTIDGVFMDNGEKVVIEMASAMGYPTEYTLSTNTKPIRGAYYGDVYKDILNFNSFIFNEDGTYETSVNIPNAVSVLEWDNYCVADLDSQSNLRIIMGYDGEKFSLFDSSDDSYSIFIRQSDPAGDSGSEGSNSDYIPGLYETGAIAKYESEGAAAIEGMMIKSWDELVAEGSIIIDNGVVYAETVLVMPEDLPEKNEYGFYYDVLYSDGYGLGFVFHEDTSVDVYLGEELQPCPAGLVTYSENSIDMTQIGFPVLTVSSDGFTMDLGDGYYISVKTPIPFAGDLMLASNCGITALGNYDEDTEEGNYAFIGKNELTGVFIPDGVTSIGARAFENCARLTSVTIPDSVTSIGDYAFQYCTSLTNITMPNVTSIGMEAFYLCENLTSITMPSVTSIGGNAFCYCTSLTSITIPDSVTSIGNYAFQNCASLTSITFEGTIAQWNAIEKNYSWKYNVPATQVVCSNGTVAL